MWSVCSARVEVVKFSLHVRANERRLEIGKYMRISCRSSGGSEDRDIAGEVPGHYSFNGFTILQTSGK